MCSQTALEVSLSQPFPPYESVLYTFVTVCTRKTRILDVVYNASNNELVRTKTLVKNAIVVVSAGVKSCGFV